MYSQQYLFYNLLNSLPWSGQMDPWTAWVHQRAPAYLSWRCDRGRGRLDSCWSSPAHSSCCTRRSRTTWITAGQRCYWPAPCTCCSEPKALLTSCHLQKAGQAIFTLSEKIVLNEQWAFPSSKYNRHHHVTCDGMKTRTLLVQCVIGHHKNALKQIQYMTLWIATAMSR